MNDDVQIKLEIKLPTPNKRKAVIRYSLEISPNAPGPIGERLGPIIGQMIDEKVELKNGKVYPK